MHLDRDGLTYESVCGSGKRQIGFDQLPLPRATAYAAECADLALRLHGLLKRRLAAERRTRVYETLDRPLVAVLAGMERHGIKVDRQILKGLSADFGQRMIELEETAYKLAGRPFNLGSPKQLGEVLFKEQGLAASRKTRTGELTTGAQVLETLAAEGHPLPRTILDWRQLQKLTGTYTDALIQEIGPDGRVHTSYAMAATSTGRLSSNDPNLQNIPIRTEEGRKIRRAFIAEAGHLPAVGRLLADRAARARPHGRDRGAQAGLRQGHRRPRGHRLADVRGPGRRHRSLASPQRQDDQLRHHLRHRRVRSRAAARHRVRGRETLHRGLFRAVSGHPRLHGARQGRGARARATSRPCSGGCAPRPRSRAAIRPGAAMPSGRRSTPRSRARPPTSCAAR